MIKGSRQAGTAEQLMRSRYTAYVKAELDYLLESTHPSQRDDYDLKGTRRWAEKSEWDGLQIVSIEGGGEEDAEGKVEFIAHYRYKGRKTTHHELAEFVREDSRWFFHHGTMVPQKQVIRKGEKTGRNDPCLCGSGLKYKKCCGK
ncbi:MAG: SEC-C domain-containing protein [Deltaproteobacteria bacterium]|nr:SEC-C domain-containing protein [Deltaproteobacteria bacterium]